MIQRIQTLYLLIVLILTSFVLACPLMELFNDTAGLFDLRVLGVYQNGELLYCTWPLLVLAVFNQLLTLGSIFMFKNRILQMRMCMLNILLFIGFCVMFAVYAWICKEKFTASINGNIPMVFPLVNILLTYLAWRAIGKDEALIRSLNHLR
ncbi:MAG TPA: DUF4293 domain-containing protein [Paludibacteraceae bacterium]|nr:DUF4293 domain-containing protein [Paludibacteraceae bacterium]HPH63997.1 DUF4293 domain-containing protein [Paludibacteraceae bacterium]